MPKQQQIDEYKIKKVKRNKQDLQDYMLVKEEQGERENYLQRDAF